MEVKGRAISKGIGRGKVLISTEPISFYGGVDPERGVVVEKGHPLEGKYLKGVVLVFPTGKGSTVGSYILLSMKKNGVSPAAIINRECDPVVAVGAIIAGIPLVDKLERDVFSLLKNGQTVKVDGNRGTVILSE
jgi:hypothetical protein